MYELFVLLNDFPHHFVVFMGYYSAQGWYYIVISKGSCCNQGLTCQVGMCKVYSTFTELVLTSTTHCSYGYAIFSFLFVNKYIDIYSSIDLTLLMRNCFCIFIMFILLFIFYGGCYFPFVTKVCIHVLVFLLCNSVW